MNTIKRLGGRVRPQHLAPFPWLRLAQNQLTEGLLFAGVVGNGAALDYVSGFPGTPIGNGTSLAGSSPSGPAMLTTSNTAQGVWFNAPALARLRNAFSVAVLVGIDSWGTFGKPFSIPARNDATWNAPFGLTLGRNSTSNQDLRLTYPSGATERGFSATSAVTNLTDGVVRLWGASRSGVNGSLYLDGALVASSSALASGDVDAVSTPNGTAPRVVLANRSPTSTGEGTAGRMVWALVWDRVLSASEWAALNQGRRDAFLVPARRPVVRATSSGTVRRRVFGSMVVRGSIK